MTELIIPIEYDPKVKVRYRKAHGYYFLDYELPAQHGEERIRQRMKIPVQNKQQANILAGKKQTALLRGEFDDVDFIKMRAPIPPDSGITFNEFLPMFRQLRERGRKNLLSPRYKEDQDNQIDSYLVPRFGNVPLHRIDDNLIDEFIGELQKEEHPQARSKESEDGKPESYKTLSNSTMNNILGHLGRILTIAKKRKKISERPLIEKLPEEHDEDFDFLDKDELLRLFDGCRGTYGNQIKTIAFTGARAMESSGWKWSDYDPITKRIRIDRQLDTRSGGKDENGRRIPLFRPPKWNSKRWIDVMPALADLLNDQAAITRLEDGLIFQTEAGNPVVHELLRRRLKQACRRAGLREITPHVLRRTFISHRIMAGDNPVEVQRLAGHRSIHVTIRYYTRLSVSFTREAASNFQEYLFGKPVRLLKKVEED